MQKNDSLFSKVFEWFTELLGWIQIMASPLLIGIAVGAFIYFPQPSTASLVIGIIVASIGLVIGVIWATKKWRANGTIFFLSRIMSTTAQNNLDDETNKTK